MRLFLVCALLAAACSKGEAKLPPSPPAASPPAARIAPIGPGAELNVNQLDVAKVKLDLAAARAAIEAYRQTHEGANPPDLQSLGLSLHFPQDLAYQPGNGLVHSKTYVAF